MSRLPGMILAALAATVLLVLAPGSAFAHSALVSSDPPDGAQLSAAPPAVTLTFSEPLLPDFVRVIGIDAAGVAEDLPIQSIDGATAVVAWPQAAPAGEWTVEYRVVSQDGHPINGTVRFSYTASTTDSPSPTATTPEPTPTSASPVPPPTTATTSPEPTSASASPSSAEPSPSTDPAAATSDTNTGWIIAGVAVVVLAVIAVVGLIMQRRSR